MKQYRTITYLTNLSGANVSAFTYPKIMPMNSEICLQISIAQFWNIGIYKQIQLYMKWEVRIFCIDWNFIILIYESRECCSTGVLITHPVNDSILQ